MKSRPALAVDNTADALADPLDAFSSEAPASTPVSAAAAEPAFRPMTPPVRRTIALPAFDRTWKPWGLAALAAGVALIGFAIVEYRGVAARTAAAEVGTLTIDSRPQGTRVVVDGQERGVTPLTLTLKPGDHGLALLNGAERRSLPVTIAAGTVVSQYFEFAPAAPAVSTGKLSVTGDVSGSRVSIDGRARGTTPLFISDLAPGDHVVAVAGEGGTVERKVTIEAGATASMVFSVPKGGVAAGWLALSAPFDVQLYENADLIGSGSAARIMLQAGRHDIRIVSQALGFEETRRVDVAGGKVSTVKVDAPKAALSANARPWADVLIDGANVGQTPLANLSVSLGSHEVLFRHPQLGEQRQTVVVTAKGPNRISVDLTRK